MEKHTFSAFDQQDVKYGFDGTGDHYARGQEIATLLHEVEELHNLKESEWSFRQYKKQFGAPACKGSYHSSRKMMRLKIDIEAPLAKVLTYLLYDPYGYRNMIEGSGGNTDVLERLGGGALVAYSHYPGQTFCCCNVAARDSVVLTALKLQTSNVAIFGMKSIEHTSRPPTEDAYRTNIPLVGLYLQQEGNVVHVESYTAEIDVGGKVGKIGPARGMDRMVRTMIQLGRAIPRMQDHSTPPYMQFM